MKSLELFKNNGARFLLIAVFVLSLAAGFVSPAAAASGKAAGAVYTMTNADGGNEVLVYNRSSDGSLEYQEAVATGGSGSGDGLGSQTALILSNNNHWLFAVNAGSDEISSFAVSKNGLELADVVDSNGSRPVSLTLYKDILYVLNAGGDGNISGFQVEKDGSLTPLTGSTQQLANSGSGPAQVAFSSDGSALVVTEKAISMIETFEVVDGIASAPVSHLSEGTTPFGFAFDRHNHAIVSEASGAVSSYDIDGSTFEPISSSVAAEGQTAACWIAISKNGKFAYTTNAGSGTISSYTIASDGSLELLEAVAGDTGPDSKPLDMAFSNNGQFMYTLAADSNAIVIFAFGADGSLGDLGSVDVPAGATGLAVR
ncbi:MAG: lactonase family protein [Anaerolineales bacterium]